MEPFIVKHYSEDERPTIKGNGFDGLEIGSDRQEAEEFVAWINELISQRKPRWNAFNCPYVSQCHRID